MNIKKLAKKHRIALEITQNQYHIDQIYKIKKLEDNEFYLIDNYNDPIMTSENIEDIFNYYIQTYV